jgi:hypothetical protein
MDNETAKKVSAVTMDCARRLHELIPFLKPRLDADEYEKLAKGIALASSYLLTEILNPVHAQYPELALHKKEDQRM